MSIGSGLAASVGLAAESVYGTYTASTRHHEVMGETLTKTKNTVQGGGLAAGRFARLASRRVLTNEGVEGSFEMEVANQKMGLLLSHLLGSSSAPVQQGATAAYLQTHVLGDNIGKFLTIQKGVPDTTGTVRPYTFKGSKILSAEFSCSVNEMLMSTWDFDGQKASEAESLAGPSYPTGLAPFHFGQMAVKLGTFGSEAAVSGVKGCTLKIERPQATDRFYAGAAGLKAEPIMNDWMGVSGSFDTDYVDKTSFADRFAADTSTSLVWEFIGPLIASTFYQTFRIKVPVIFINEGTPQVSGPDIVGTSYSFEGQFDGTNSLVSVEYMSIDTAI